MERSLISYPTLTLRDSSNPSTLQSQTASFTSPLANAAISHYYSLIHQYPPLIASLCVSRTTLTTTYCRDVSSFGHGISFPLKHSPTRSSPYIQCGHQWPPKVRTETTISHVCGQNSIWHHDTTQQNTKRYLGTSQKLTKKE